MSNFRIGYGYDVHRLVDGRPLILGGVNIPYKKGLSGHSDADVLLHAISDALLGAVAEGDIGLHFPDTDKEFENADSRILLQKVVAIIRDKGYGIQNIDATVVAQQPKLASYIGKMRNIISTDLDLDPDQVSIKATTSEGLGFEGEGKGISASAVVLIFKS